MDGSVHCSNCAGNERSCILVPFSKRRERPCWLFDEDRIVCEHSSSVALHFRILLHPASTYERSTANPETTSDAVAPESNSAFHPLLLRRYHHQNFPRATQFSRLSMPGFSPQKNSTNLGPTSTTHQTWPLVRTRSGSASDGEGRSGRT